MFIRLWPKCMLEDGKMQEAFDVIAAGRTNYPE